VNLYFRLLALLFRLPWLPRKALLDESRLALRVWPTDCDLNLHLNDGRYVTLMGLGRLHLVTQIGLAGRILRERWRPITAAVDIVFIRSVLPFRGFDLVSRVLSWDDKYTYMEHRFESNGVLHAKAMVKVLFLGRGGHVSSAAIAASLGHAGAPPAFSRELALWVEKLEAGKGLDQARRSS